MLKLANESHALTHLSTQYEKSRASCFRKGSLEEHMWCNEASLEASGCPPLTSS